MKAQAIAYDANGVPIARGQEITKGADFVDMVIKAAESLQRQFIMAGDPRFASIEVKLTR